MATEKGEGMALLCGRSFRVTAASARIRSGRSKNGVSQRRRLLRRAVCGGKTAFIDDPRLLKRFVVRPHGALVQGNMSAFWANGLDKPAFTRY